MGGCLPRGCHVTHTPSWTEFLTQAYENIAFPQLLLRAVKWTGGVPYAPKPINAYILIKCTNNLSHQVVKHEMNFLLFPEKVN